MTELLVDVGIRDAVADDVPLILASWLRTGAESRYARAIGRHVWFINHEKLLREQVLPRSRVKVAHLPDDESVILAWMCYEGDILHYVFCKPRWQKLGVVQHLVASVPPFAVATHKADGRQVYPYNPYPLFLGASWPHSNDALSSSKSPTLDQAPV